MATVIFTSENNDSENKTQIVSRENKETTKLPREEWMNWYKGYLLAVRNGERPKFFSMQ